MCETHTEQRVITCSPVQYQILHIHSDILESLGTGSLLRRILWPSAKSNLKQHAAMQRPLSAFCGGVKM
jgi:hypothetical protein